VSADGGYERARRILQDHGAREAGVTPDDENERTAGR
jgi:hypothetical protein